MSLFLFGFGAPGALLTDIVTTIGITGVVLIVAALKIMFLAWLTLRFIPNHSVGVIEKLWSAKGSVPEGHILALNGEAGFQADLLRGGIHFGYWRWQYRVHLCPLVTVPQGKIGYVYARDGQPLSPSQTLGHAVGCNNFQDARAFLVGQASSLPDKRQAGSLPHVEECYFGGRTKGFSIIWGSWAKGFSGFAAGGPTK